MGFYGTVFQELTNAFASFIIKTATGNVEMKAQGTGGKFTIGSDNNWIKLSADKENYLCNIAHSEIDSKRDGYSILPFAPGEANNTDSVVNLSAGTIVKIPNLKYDKAGHIIGNSDYSLYRLPVNETELNLTELTQRMTTLETAESKQNSDIQTLTSTTSEHDDSINDLQERMIAVEGFDSRISIVEDSSEVMSNLLGERSSLTKEANMTITEAIGNIDDFLDSTTYDNICEGVTELTGRVNATNLALNGNLLVVKGVFEKLCKTLQENGINVTIEDLWQ